MTTPRKRVLGVPPSRLHPAALAVFADEVDVVDGAALTAVELATAIADAHGIVGALTEEQLGVAANLEVIGVPGSGTDHIDVTAATDRGIFVVNAAGGQASAVAEHTVGLMLALAKRIAVSDRIFHTEGRFVGRAHFTGDGWPGWPHELSGSTIGIVGFGAIGRDLARKCRLAFDMRVLAYDPHCPADTMHALGVEPVASLAALLPESDWVTLHVPLTDETRGLVGEAELRAMRPTASLINLARGGVVDEDALVHALRAGWIAGAGLDVFAEEPGPDGNPLFAMENVVCTAHIGGWVEEAVPRLAAIMAGEMLVALRGERPGRLANPEAWDRQHP